MHVCCAVFWCLRLWDAAAPSHLLAAVVGLQGDREGQRGSRYQCQVRRCAQPPAARQGLRTQPRLLQEPPAGHHQHRHHWYVSRSVRGFVTGLTLVRSGQPKVRLVPG